MRIQSLATLAAIAIAVPSTAASDCSPSFQGTFELTAMSLVKRDHVGATENALYGRDICTPDKTLVMTLSDGVLTDGTGRTAYIASNSQLQFDNPPQSNALTASGFSICTNGSMALHGSAIWSQCVSGTFSNLYSVNGAEQCSPSILDVLPCKYGEHFSVPASVATGPVVDVIQTFVIGTSTLAVPTQVAVPLCEIGDGQVQAPATPCAGGIRPIITVPIVTSHDSPAPSSFPTSVPAAPPAYVSASPAPAPSPVPAPLPSTLTSVLSSLPNSPSSSLTSSAAVGTTTTTTASKSTSTTVTHTTPTAPKSAAASLTPVSLLALGLAIVALLVYP